MPNLLPHSLADLTDLRPFRRIRLIAFDLDGTLLPHELVLRFRHLSLSLRQRDVRLVLATGRTLAGVEPLLGQVVLPGTQLVLYNGSLILENTTFSVIAQRTIPVLSVAQIVRISLEERTRVLAYYFNAPIRASSELFGVREQVVGWAAPSSDELPATESNRLSVTWVRSSMDIPAEAATAVLIQVDGDNTRAQRLRARLESLLSISVTQSGSTYLEIRPNGSNKAVALAEVARSLGVDQQDVLAIGDNDNDAEMLEWAGIGVAVDKASDLAISRSDYVCRRGTFSGVIELLRIVKDAKRFFHD